MDEAAAVLEAQDVDRGGERAGLATSTLVLDEPGLGEAAERPGGGVLADPELPSDAPDAGDREQPAVVSEMSIEGEVFENSPRRGPQPSAGLAGFRSHEQAGRCLAT
jgi:hypothetical protein